MKPRMDPALQRPWIDFLQRHTSTGHLRLRISLVAAPGQRVARHRLHHAPARVAVEMRERERSIHAGIGQERIGQPCRQVTPQRAADRPLPLEKKAVPRFRVERGRIATITLDVPEKLNRVTMPARGQLAILLPQPEIQYAYMGSAGYMFPRADGIVLGGTFELDQWDTTPDPAAIARILASHKIFYDGFRCRN